MIALVLFSVLFFVVGTGIIFFIFELLLPALNNTLNQQHILFSQVESGNFALEQTEASAEAQHSVFEPNSKAFRFWNAYYRFVKKLEYIFNA